MCRPVAIACLLIFCMYHAHAEENFLLVKGRTNEKIVALGSHLYERFSPCSTFKIPLSLMGYDAEILKNTNTPTWEFQEGYDNFLEAWKTPQTPQSWMKFSCIWYSKILALQLGLEKIQNYLAYMEYGNQDMSTGMTEVGPQNPAWVQASLKISAKEQVDFLQKMLQGNLAVSRHAIEMTKTLLFKEALPNDWQLFGKTGWSGSVDENGLEYGWFVGWIEKEDLFFPFAYLIREKKINLDQRIPRVKQLLLQSHIMTTTKSD